MIVLPDGTYDAVVIDAEDDGEGLRLELTIATGPHKGDVVAVKSNLSAHDPLACLGLPARLVVEGDGVRVELEPYS